MAQHYEKPDRPGTAVADQRCSQTRQGSKYRQDPTRAAIGGIKPELFCLLENTETPVIIRICQPLMDFTGSLLILSLLVALNARRHGFPATL